MAPGSGITRVDQSTFPVFGSNSPSVKAFPLRHSLAVLLLVWILSLAWFGIFLHRGWVPYDDGMLSQSAERVLQGELPHRDFDEVYTGGLDYLNAAAFRMFGMNLMSLRLMLYIFFALWVPAFYFCASRLASPLAAGLATLLAVAWSAPNYPAAMPSWYNLFFATFGLAALFKYLETRARQWLVVAGLCGGFSFLVKSPGLYFVAAGLLFFLFREQSEARPRIESDVILAPSGGKLYRLFLDASLVAFVGALAILIRRLADLPELYDFVLPGLALALVLLARESRPSALSDLSRLRNLSGLVAPFLAGAILPVGLFLVPYAFSHSLGSFYNGVFVLPFKRISIVAFRPPSLDNLAALLFPLGILAFAFYSKWRESIWVVGTVLTGLAIVFFASSHNRGVYQFAWMSAATLIPAILVIGALALTRASDGWKLDEMRRQRIFLILAVTALCSLIQFPYSSPTYFCYVAPMAALSVLAILSARNPKPRLLPAFLAVFYVAFAIFHVTPGFLLDSMSRGYAPARPTRPLNISRAGGLRIDPEEAQTYERLISLVQQKATNGQLYAGPDCPEVYFLSGFRNPTRMIFDAFEDYSQETPRVLSAIDTANPGVIVINRLPTFSNPLDGDLRQTLEARFPEMANIGKFQVRWRP